MCAWPQSHDLRAKIEKNPDIISIEHVMFEVPFSCSALHIVQMVRKDKVYFSEQKLSGIYFLWPYHLPKIFVVYRIYSLNWFEKREKWSSHVLTDLEMHHWRRSIHKCISFGCAGVKPVKHLMINKSWEAPDARFQGLLTLYFPYARSSFITTKSFFCHSHGLLDFSHYKALWLSNSCSIVGFFKQFYMDSHHEETVEIVSSR